MRMEDFVLGWEIRESVLLCTVDLFGAIQLSVSKVQVIPLESQQFSPGAGRLVPPAGTARSTPRLWPGSETADLLTGQHLHLPGFLRRRLAADGWIHADQPSAPLFQGGPAVHVAGPHHAVSDSCRSVLRREASLFFRGVGANHSAFCVQLSQGCCPAPGPEWFGAGAQFPALASNGWWAGVSAWSKFDTRSPSTPRKAYRPLSDLGEDYYRSPTQLLQLLIQLFVLAKTFLVLVSFSS